MKDPLSTHLSDDEFAAYLIGASASPEVEAHVSACEVCRAEVTAFGSSVESLNAASLAWSESRRFSSLAGVPGRGRSTAVSTRVSWALTACLAVAAGVAVVAHEDHRSASPVAVAVAQEDSEAQIREDNELLMAVDQATSGSVLSPVQEYGLGRSSADGAKSRHVRNAND